MQIDSKPLFEIWGRDSAGNQALNGKNEQFIKNKTPSYQISDCPFFDNGNSCCLLAG